MDTSNPLWKEIEDWAKRRIEDYRDTLEAQEDPEARGSIRSLRELIALGDTPEITEIQSVDYDT